MNYQNPHGPTCPWYDITERVGAPNLKWCEETICQWVSEPSNTWSNIGFLVCGLVILFYGIKKNHHSNMKQFGPIIFLMGAMSLFYHLSNFYGTQILDFVGMFLFVGWVIGMNLVRLGKLKSNKVLWFNLGFCFLNCLIMHVMYLTGLKFQALILISGFVIVATEFMARKLIKVHYNWFFASLAILIFAFGFSISDGQRIWCDPSQHGWFSQGHALWHWIGSLAMFTIYMHFSQAALSPQKDSEN
jgi:hypothetical protein